MIRRTAAILIALASIFVIAGCSSSDNAKKVDETTTTTEDDSTTTTEDSETTTTADEGLKSKIDLGGLSSASSGGLSDADGECIASGVLDDPVLSSYDSFEELRSGPQEDLEAFYTIMLDCVGAEPIIDLFMQGVASDGSFDSTQLACIRTTTENLSADEGVKLLAGDPDVTSTWAIDVSVDCGITG